MIKLKHHLKNLSEEELTKLILATNKINPEEEYLVYFSDKKKTRSLPQNRYLWGVVYHKIAELTGYDAEDIHEMMKVKFGLRTQFNVFEGELIEFARSTRFMDTRQFSEYIEKIRKWSLDALGVYIPQPNEITDEDYINSQYYN
jgi:hypothetical protein